MIPNYGVNLLDDKKNVICDGESYDRMPHKSLKYSYKEYQQSIKGSERNLLSPDKLNLRSMSSAKHGRNDTKVKNDCYLDSQLQS
jgi:hypothetical protein